MGGTFQSRLLQAVVIETVEGNVAASPGLWKPWSGMELENSDSQRPGQPHSLYAGESAGGLVFGNARDQSFERHRFGLTFHNWQSIDDLAARCRPLQDTNTDGRVQWASLGTSL